MKADIMVQKWGLGWGRGPHSDVEIKDYPFLSPHSVPGPTLQTLAVLYQVAELWASQLFLAFLEGWTLNLGFGRGKNQLPTT